VAAAWLVVAAVVGLLVGRVIRERDRQVPPSPDAAPAPAADEGRAPRVEGRGRQRRR
jgi:hypothetical protein